MYSFFLLKLYKQYQNFYTHFDCYLKCFYVIHYKVLKNVLFDKIIGKAFIDASATIFFNNFHYFIFQFCRYG